MKKFLAFTLAEVLITLSILGVVAAITVPSLINRNTEKQTVTKLKKEYSALAEAYEQIVATDGPASKWLSASNSQTQNAEILASHFKPYLAVAKDCGHNSGCFNTGGAKYLNGTSSAMTYDSVNDKYKILLKDGSSFLFDTGANLSYVAIIVDIDGPKGKNTFGKDLFCFRMADKGIIPRGAKQAVSYGIADETLAETCNRNVASGWGCAAWIIAKGNMDYLRKNVSWD